MPPTRHSCGVKGMRSCALSVPKASAVIPLAKTHGAKLSNGIGCGDGKIGHEPPGVACHTVPELDAMCRATQQTRALQTHDRLTVPCRLWTDASIAGICRTNTGRLLTKIAALLGRA